MTEPSIWNPTQEEARKTLLIDDQRTFPARVICRTVTDGMRALVSMGPFETLLLDQNLFCYGDDDIGMSILVLLSRWAKEQRPKRIISVSATAAKELTEAAAALVGEENTGWINIENGQWVFRQGIAT